MATLTPLQLTATASLLQNQGLLSLPASLTTATTNFNSTAVITAWSAAVAFYRVQSWATPSTLDALLSIGSTACPALGNSVPAAPLGTFANLQTIYASTDTDGFSEFITTTGNAYLGNGNYSMFVTGFMTVQGYLSTVNSFITSAANVNNYLGPTFTNMDNLVTADIASTNTNLPAFGKDLAAQGQLVELGNLELYGTPAGLLQQLSNVSGITGQSMPAVQDALIAAGLTSGDITDLVNDNRQSLINPDGLTQNEFDTLQKSAYAAMTQITGTDLQEVLSVLDVTTPNVSTMADLLNPLVMFPNSYSTMQTMGPFGTIPVFDSTGAVSAGVSSAVSSFLPTSTGCDELGKVIPPASAVSNKAIQVALQQIPGVSDSNLPQLAETINGFAPDMWNPANEYLADAVVEYNGNPYRAQQDIPLGTDITDPDYWEITSLGGLNTMADLPLIQAQTTAVDPSVTAYFDNTVATGSGPNKTITTTDVWGLAIDVDNFAAKLTLATDTITTLNTLGALNTLKATYANMLTAIDDAAMLGYISTANANIASIAVAQPASVLLLNTQWIAMATSLNKELTYQLDAGYDYTQTPPSNTTSIYGFVLNLTQYAFDIIAGGACEFLQDISDTATLGGQAIVGVMREARNTMRLGDGNLLTTANQVPPDPTVTPTPAVVPVN
jgi:hypothetical protein